MNLLEQTFENVFSFLFDSPREKQKRKLKLAFEKGIQACINGKVSQDSMSICEKIACELPRDANDCKDPEILLEYLLAYCQSGSNVVNMEPGKDYWPCNVQRELSTLLEWKVLGPAMRIGLYYLLEKWDGSDLSQVKDIDDLSEYWGWYRSIVINKAKAWQYENEWRLMAIEGKSEEIGALRFWRFDRRILKSVDIGPRVSASDKKEILNIVAELYPKVEVREVVPDSRLFKIDYTRIR